MLRFFSSLLDAARSIVSRFLRKVKPRRSAPRRSRIFQEPQTLDHRDEPAIPKIIWMIWFQGWDEAPDIVQACRKTWQAHNPNWTVHLLTRTNLQQYLDMDALSAAIEGKAIPAEALSDFIRIHLLERYGGVWVDATLYSLIPIDQWLPERLSSGFFAFANPGPDRMVASWFLAAFKGSYVVQEWRRRAVEYWKERKKRDEYFWFHYLFADAYQEDQYFRAIWDSTPEVPADGPHHYLPYDTLCDPASPADLALLTSPSTPVLKLTHKLPKAHHESDSIVGVLCSQAEDLLHPRPTEAAVGRHSLSQPRRLLVSWYGSFAGHGTIGDLLAMQSVASHLAGIGHKVSHASAGDLRVPGCHHVAWESASPGDFDTCIFVCGPILRSHPQTQALFQKFTDLTTIGVSVSLFPPDHSNYLDPFDAVLAREGKPERFEDVAILAPVAFDQPRRKSKRPPTIGLVLRGEQAEYGPRRCLWERTEEIIQEAAANVLRQLGGRTVRIENHLGRSGLPQSQIEAQYADCDLILTSRFHGAMMALRHFVPFIALDQIRGGAKLVSLLGGSGWPHIYEASSVDAARVFHDASRLLSGDGDQKLLAVRSETHRKANATLMRLGSLVERIG